MSELSTQSEINRIGLIKDQVIEDETILRNHKIQSLNNIESHSPSRQSFKIQSMGLLSPKGDISSKMIGQQSPQIQKNKYNILKKLYEKALQQKQQMNEFDKKYNQKKQELGGYKIILHNQIKLRIDNAEYSKQDLVKEKMTQISRLENQLHDLRVDNKKLDQSHRKIENLRNETRRIDEELSSKQSNGRINQNIVQAKIHDRQQQLKHHMNNLQGNKNIKEAQNQLQKRKNNQKQYQLVAMSEKTQEIMGKYSSQKPGFIDVKREEFALAIQRKKHQIKAAKALIQCKSNKEHELEENGFNTDQIVKLKSEVNQLNKIYADLQKASELSKNQIKQTNVALKNDVNNIDKIKQKISQKTKQIKKLEIQKQNIESQIAAKGHPKPKYIEKMPEQLEQLHKIKCEFKKKINMLIDLQNKQKQTNTCVPPIIIDDLNKRIEALLIDHKQYTQIASDSLKLIEENKKLIIQRDGLEWEKNTDLKMAEDNKKKEQVKNHQIAQEVQNLRKNVNAVSLKLEQYQVTYPEFKPEKKAKKQQPQPVAQQKKQQPNKKGNKNNKALKLSPSASQQMIVIEQKPALVKDQVKQANTSKLMEQTKPDPTTSNKKNKKKK